MAHDAAQLPPSTLLEYALQVVDSASNEGAIIRLCGGLACWYHATEVARAFSAAAGRTFSDVDFVAYVKDRQRIVTLLRSLGLHESHDTATVPGNRRAIFNGANGLHVDVFYDVLEFCHPIDLRHRLEMTSPTIPLSDLLLHKTQIVDLTTKDIIDLQTLLHDFDFAEDDRSGISEPRIAALCGSSWGLYHTTTLSIDKCVDATQSAQHLDARQRGRVLAGLERLQQLLRSAPKSLRWRARSVVGEHVPWYEAVESEPGVS